jgi:hypothetical protein
MPASKERRSHGWKRYEVVVDTSKSLRLPIPTGLSFEVEDLVRMRKWADLNDYVAQRRVRICPASRWREGAVWFGS